MAEEPKDDESCGASSCLSLQLSCCSFEGGNTASDANEEDSQCRVVVYLYQPEDSNSKTEIHGESLFVSLIAEHS